MTSKFLYPRVVSISRQVETDNPGEQQSYGGMTPATESVVAANLPAHIEAERQGAPPSAKLPADTAGQSIWLISIPAKRAKLGLIRGGDFITDELGNRYYVISADWSPLVTTCRSQIQEN